MKKIIIMMMIFVANFIFTACNSLIEEPELKGKTIDSGSVDLDLIKATNDAKNDIRAFSGRLSTDEVSEDNGQDITIDLGNANSRVAATYPDMSSEGNRIMSILDSKTVTILNRIERLKEQDDKLQNEFVAFSNLLTDTFNTATNSTKITEIDREIIKAHCYANQELLETAGAKFFELSSSGTATPNARTNGLWKVFKKVLRASIRYAINISKSVVKNAVKGCGKGLIAGGVKGCIAGATAEVTKNIKSDSKAALKSSACAWNTKISSSEVVNGTKCTK
jgi:hypothetical protein